MTKDETTFANDIILLRALANNRNMAEWKEIDWTSPVLQAILRNSLKKMILQHEQYERAHSFLLALEAAGVDNWEGYAHAHEIMAEWYGEDND